MDPWSLRTSCSVCLLAVDIMFCVCGVSLQKPGQPSNETIVRMYEMGDEMERKPFLDKLFGYMEDRGTPISAMPCISKQPIDLFRLYCMVKEKGGLYEVSSRPCSMTCSIYVPKFVVCPVVGGQASCVMINVLW